MWSSPDDLDADQSVFNYVSPWISSPPISPNLTRSHPSTVKATDVQISHPRFKLPELPENPTRAMLRLNEKPAVRTVHFRTGRHMIPRASNHEALFVQHVGKEAVVPCAQCANKGGPFTKCVTVDGELRGSCANCHFGSGGARCSLRSKGIVPRSKKRSHPFRSLTRNSSFQVSSDYSTTVEDLENRATSSSPRNTGPGTLGAYSTRSRNAEITRDINVASAVAHNPSSIIAIEDQNNAAPLIRQHRSGLPSRKEVRSALRVYRRLNAEQKTRFRDDMGTIDNYEALEIDEADDSRGKPNCA